MEKFKTFVKEMRFEYKVLSIFIIILFLSVPYSIIKKNLFPVNNAAVSSANYGAGTGEAGVTGNSLSDMQQNSAPQGDASKQASSISEAVNAERPLILNDKALHNENYQQIMVEIPEIKYIETATQVENPTVWIYSLNDGLRKDDAASKYCSVLHSRGIMASKVTIYDEKERRNGRLIELGAAKCM
ncbi:MAG: hypothetical protein K2N11_01880 [Mucispirillum sp.]|nr:hypothetical protein [Mucispirillum sp.]